MKRMPTVDRGKVDSSSLRFQLWQSPVRRHRVKPNHLFIIGSTVVVKNYTSCWLGSIMIWRPITDLLKASQIKSSDTPYASPTSRQVVGLRWSMSLCGTSPFSSAIETCSAPSSFPSEDMTLPLFRISLSTEFIRRVLHSGHIKLSKDKLILD